ncbi:MAG: transposase [Tannerella sp.]|nr:transposase [Tannerella sp.]
MFYLLKTGCQWRMLPPDFPKWQLVYYYCSKWKEDGTIEEIHEVLRAQFRKKTRSRRVSMRRFDRQPKR